MSLLDKLKNFTQPYADDDDYDEFEDEETVDTYEEETEEEARPARRRPIFNFSSTEEEPVTRPTPAPSTGFSGQVVTMGGKQEVVLFRPVNFNDTSKAAEDLRNKKAVIANMENVDKAMARRVVDFLSGCSYALDGKVKKIAQSTYLFCPHNMDVVGDLENLQSEIESYV